MPRTLRSPRSAARAALGAGAAIAVLASLAGSASAGYPGANGRLAYGEGPAFGPDHIVTIDADGSAREVVHAGGGLPSWSADGRRLVFFDSPEDRPHNTDVWAMDADGSHLRRVTTDPADDWNPDWSPDGRRIAFSSLRDGNREIYLMNADGSDQQDVSGMPHSWEDSPVWSPDGSRIAFNSLQGGHYQLYVMQADGSSKVNLLPAAADLGNPDWAPDGSRLAFESDLAGDGTHVYTMRPDGSDVGAGGPGPPPDTAPPWSPDRTPIAYIT
jgi:Tol biopolymer transport system component